MRGIVYGIIGGIFSYVAFWLLSIGVLRGDDIAVGTVILSAVICCCTGILVEKLNNK